MKNNGVRKEVWRIQEKEGWEEQRIGQYRGMREVNDSFELNTTFMELVILYVIYI